MDKLYTVNDECTAIHEWPVVYESKESYFAYGNGGFAEQPEQHIDNVGVCGGVFFDKELAKAYATWAFKQLDEARGVSQ